MKSPLTFLTFYFVFVSCFYSRIPVSSLVDSWPSLLALLKDSVPLGLPAPGQFLILGYVSLPPFNCTCLYPHNIKGITFTITLNGSVGQVSEHSMDWNESICREYLFHDIFPHRFIKLSICLFSFRVLNEFILKNPNLESKKDQRELQVITL